MRGCMLEEAPQIIVDRFEALEREEVDALTERFWTASVLPRANAPLVVRGV
jgi:hypothetical protein